MLVIAAVRLQLVLATVLSPPHMDPKALAALAVRASTWSSITCRQHAIHTGRQRAGRHTR